MEFNAEFIERRMRAHRAWQDSFYEKPHGTPWWREMPGVPRDPSPTVQLPSGATYTKCSPGESGYFGKGGI